MKGQKGRTLVSKIIPSELYLNLDWGGPRELDGDSWQPRFIGNDQNITDYLGISKEERMGG